MSSDNQFTALGPATVGFQTDGTNIDLGAALSGNVTGLRSTCQTGNAIEAVVAENGGAAVLGAVATPGAKYFEFAAANLLADANLQVRNVGVRGIGPVGVSGTGASIGVFGDGGGDNIHLKVGGIGVKGRSHFDDAVVGECSREGKSGVFGFNELLAGPAYGVSGTVASSEGAGVNGFAGSGVGVRGASETNDGVVGSSNTVAKSGLFGYNLYTGGPAYGVSGTVASSEGAGVNGFADSGIGVLGTSETNDGVVGSGGRYGGSFDGASAAIRLVPSDVVGSPTSGTHAVGELYLDASADLFLCKESGAPGRWVLIA